MSNEIFQELTEADSISMDPVGRVVLGEKIVYRLIERDYQNLIKEIFSSGLIEELVSKNLLVESKLSLSPEIEMIIEHKKLFQSSLSDWSIDMLLSAAKTTLLVNDIANKYGYELKDAHSQNILFDCGIPKWIDLGSFTPKNGKSWIAKKQFFYSFMLPLEIYNRDDIYLFKKLIQGYFYPGDFTLPEGNIESSKMMRVIISKLLKQSIRLHPKLGNFKILNAKISGNWDSYFKKAKFLQSEYIYPNFTKLKYTVNQYSLTNKNTEWGEYHNSYDSTEHRFGKLLKYFNDLNYDNSIMLDIAGNQGFLSNYLLSNKIFKSSINIDYDGEAIRQGRKKFIGKEINFIWANPFTDYKEKGLIYKYKADVIFVMALIHHLILTQKMNIIFIMYVLKLYTNKYLVIEFIPLGLWDGNDKIKVPEWYTHKWFEFHLSEKFNILNKEELAPNRIVYIAKKI